MSDWMKNQSQTDIQQAIDSQAIQTVLEKYNSPTDDPNYGYPKIIKLINKNFAQNTANGNIVLAFDTLSYNYGGFGLSQTGANYTGVVVPEPGIYTWTAQVPITLVPLAFLGVYAGLNGVAGTFSDGSVCATNYNGAQAPATGSIFQATGTVPLKAGDVINTIVACYGATAVTVNGTGYTWMTLERQGWRQ